MIKEVSFKEKFVTINTSKGIVKDIDVGFQVYKIIKTDKRVIILLNGYFLHETEYHNRNIICLNEQGEIVWRVENPDLLSISKERTPNAFTNITLKENNKIEAFKFDCYTVDIDINTGKFVSDWVFTK